MDPVRIEAVVARAVRAERVRAGMSQAALAQDLGWSRQTLTNLENGDRHINIAELPAICRALHVTLAELARDASAEDRRALGLDRSPDGSAADGLPSA